jgi:hypothetical protein
MTEPPRTPTVSPATTVPVVPAPREPVAGETVPAGSADPGPGGPRRPDRLRRVVDRWVRLREERPWVRAFERGATGWMVGHVAYFAMVLFSRLGDRDWNTLRESLDHWSQQDTGWYLQIAERGYHGDAAAFFPLYPLLIRAVGGGLVGALVIANLALLGALTVLYRFVESETDGPTAWRAGWYLMAFPTGFFLVAAYPHGLFLLLAVGSVYAMRRRRWWVAGVLAALAGATRQVGVLLVVPFALEYLRQRRVRPDALAVLLVPSGLVAFMVYLHYAVGDALAFTHVQASWLRTARPPWWSLARAVSVFERLPLVTNQLNLLELGTVLFVGALLVLSVVGPWRLRRDQWSIPAYGAAVLLVVLCYPTTKQFQPLMSADRLLVEAFPAFLLLARLGARPVLDRLYLLVAVGVQSALLVHFLHDGWVA